MPEAERVCIIGSGNWYGRVRDSDARGHRGSCVSKIIGTSVQRLSCQDGPWLSTVNMWVFEELVDGQKLSEIINEQHENVKYNRGRRSHRIDICRACGCRQMWWR